MGKKIKTGVELIAAKRQRQIDKHGWTPEHDDRHVNGELAMAGAVYAKIGSLRAQQRPMPLLQAIKQAELDWPWGEDFAPSSNPIETLANAGALIAAEIDRLQRRGA